MLKWKWMYAIKDHNNFRIAHSQFVGMVKAMPDDEMLTPGFNAFAGKAAIVDWMVSYASQDKWGRAEIWRW